MKKIITLCSVIVVLAIVITAFTACGDKTEDNTTTTTTEAVVELGGTVVEIGEENAVITEDGFVVQTLNYPKDSDVTIDLEYAKEHNEFIDFNFDGVADFYIAVSTEDGIINYYCWIYNESTKLYEYSKDLSALKNISVDPEKHLVVSTIPQADGNKITCYRWVDGVLTMDVAYDSSKDEIPEEVTEIVENNSIGADKKPSTNKPETTKKPSSGNKETTKKPSSDNKETTKKPASDNTGTTKKPASDNKETTKKPTSANTETTKKPIIVTTTQASVQNGVVLNTDSNIDDGWF